MAAQKRKSTWKAGPSKRQKSAPTVRRTFNNATTAPAPTRVELKYDYGFVTTAPVDSTPSVTLLSTIANGTGSSDRIGKRIAYHDIEISWAWLYNADHSLNTAGFFIVYDNAPNGSLPAYTDIINDSSVTTLQNPDQRGRFKILFRTNFNSVDRTGATVARTAFQGPEFGHKIISLKGKGAHFIGTANTIASMEKGAIYLLTNSYADNVVALEFTNQIQYSDA